LAAPNNPKGAKSDKLWRDAIQRAVKRRLNGEGEPQALDRLADALVTKGLEGDIPAIKEIGDRLDGKAAQSIMTDDENGPIKLEITWAKSSES